jgi:hypothetical protein
MTRRLGALHLAGNALLLCLGYYWLGIPESSLPTLAWSFLLALAILCGAAWLHGTAFAYFQTPDLPTALRKAGRHLLPLVALGIAILAVYWLLSLWAAYSPQPAFQIASYLTLKLRKPVRPAAVLTVFSVVLWLVRWALLPLLLLPLAAAVSRSGWRGFGSFQTRGRHHRLYWIVAPLLLLSAFWAPFQLLHWTPLAGGFGLEVLSFLIRITVAYLLFVGACLLLAFTAASTEPRP